MINIILFLLELSLHLSDTRPTILGDTNQQKRPGCCKPGYRWSLNGAFKCSASVEASGWCHRGCAPNEWHEAEVLVLVLLGALLGHLSLSLQADGMWNDRTSQNYLSHENKAFIIFHPILLCWLFWLLNVDTPKMGYSIIVNPRISKVGLHPFPCKSNSYCHVTSWILHCCRMIQKMSLQQVGISRTGRESRRETTQMNEKNGSIFWYHFFLTTVAHYVTLVYDDI